MQTIEMKSFKNGIRNIHEITTLHVAENEHQTIQISVFKKRKSNQDMCRYSNSILFIYVFNVSEHTFLKI